MKSAYFDQTYFNCYFPSVPIDMSPGRFVDLRGARWSKGGGSATIG